MTTLRTLLTLGRVSNLPTVWSNCLAAWLLAGGRLEAKLAFICAGGSCFYLGGMFLNDACDVGFDRQHRTERPIPAGEISREKVFVWSAVWMALGMTLLMFHEQVSLPLAVMLLVAITTYNFLHKIFAPAIVLMALCRFLLYLVAASAVASHLPILVLTSATAMAIYVLGISLLARRESKPGKLPGWVATVLLTPLILAGVHFSNTSNPVALIVSGLVFAVWAIWSLQPAFGNARAVGPAAGRLLAGLVLLDWLNVVSTNGWASYQCLIFATLFVVTLLLQRRVPAT